MDWIEEVTKDSEESTEACVLPADPTHSYNLNFEDFVKEMKSYVEKDRENSLPIYNFEAKFPAESVSILKGNTTLKIVGRISGK